MDVDRFCTACFSGYRPEKFPFSLEDKASSQYLWLQESIHTAIMEALRLGYLTFLCGMAKGFDLLCADTLLDIREQYREYSNIRLVAVLPYASHKFAGDWGNMHRIVKTCAEQVVIISPDYAPDCFQQRNRYMVENSSHLIYYWDGQEGGTAQTVWMARKQGLTMQNACEKN